MPAHFLLTMLCTPRTPLESHMLLMGAGPTNGGGGFVGPLDALVSQGASLAAVFAPRRLLSSYNGSALRIRSDGTGSPEADIGFTSLGDLDATALASAIAAGGGSNGYFRKWYDQSGNGREAGNSTSTQQPLYAAGAHAKGSAYFDGSNDQLDTASFTQAQSYYIVAVANVRDQVSTNGLCGAVGSTPTQVTIGYAAQIFINAGSGIFSSVAMTSNTWYAIRALFNGASSSVQRNAGSLVTGNAGTTGINGGFRLGNRFDGSWPWRGSISELLVFAGDPTGLAGWSTFYNGIATYYGL